MSEIITKCRKCKKIHDRYVGGNRIIWIACDCGQSIQPHGWAPINAAIEAAEQYQKENA